MIEGFGRLGKTKSAPDGNARQRGLADRSTRGPASSGADLDGSSHTPSDLVVAGLYPPRSP
jgi:hypothetical protein